MSKCKCIFVKTQDTEKAHVTKHFEFNIRAKSNKVLLVVGQFDVNNCSGRPAVERGTDELTLTATLSLFVASYHSSTAILALQLSTDTDKYRRHTHRQ